MSYVSSYTNKPVSSETPPRIDTPIFWCQTCSVKFDAPHVAYQHFNSPKHKSKTTNGSTTIVHTNSNEQTTVTVQQPLHCTLCDVALNSAITAEMHYNSKKHMNKV